MRLTFKGFVSAGMVYAAIRPTRFGTYSGRAPTGWRVRTSDRPQSAALFAASCLASGITLLARCETAEGKSRIVPICRSGKLARGARQLLSMLLSDDEFKLLLLFGVSRRTMYGGAS